MDLPTYTNIWRIEKRLYKLYDLRLPMPLPLGQIAAFVAITVPYVLFLTLIGIPFSHNLFWLYVLPPGLLTWLVTRPVLENKKLPELLISQARYLGEPKVWCRMAPATEKDEVLVLGQVWHARRAAAPQAAAVPARRLVPVPAYPRASFPEYMPGQPTWASPVSGTGHQPAEPRRRAPATWGPQPAMTAGQPGARDRRPAAGQGAVRDPRAEPGFVPQQVRTGAGPVPDSRVVPHGSPVRQRAAAPARPQRRPVRPASTPAQRGQQPTWATRARPSGPLGRPAETARRPRVIEVAHAEQGRPAAPPADEALAPVSRIGSPHPAASVHAAPRSAHTGGPLVPAGPPPSAHAGPPPSAHAGPPPSAHAGPPPSAHAGPPPSAHAGPPPSAHAGPPPVPAGPPVPTAPPSVPGAPLPVPGGPLPVPGARPSPPADPPADGGQRIAPYVPYPSGAAQPGEPIPGAPRPEGEVKPPAPAAAADPGTGAGRGGGRPVPLVTVTRGPGEEREAPPVERALSGPAGPRGRNWNDRVRLVPGGHGPGKSREAEQEERDQARARLPLPGPRRIVVLGCTSGAGQTVTALMVARLLASLRAERVAAVDLNPGGSSLTQRAQSPPAGTVGDLLGGTASAPSGVAVGHPGPVGDPGSAGDPCSAGDPSSAGHPAPVGDPGSAGHPAPVDLAGHLRPGADAIPGVEVIDAEADPASVRGLDETDFSAIGDHLVARYGISLVDPGAAAVARVLAIADQLILVAPASADAPRAVSMTQEWLASHDHTGLAASAVMVMNGVSGRSMADVERAEAIASGRCRAIVRVPWEDQLGADGGPCAGAAALRPATRRALTALAGVLVSGLAAGPAAGSGERP